MKRLMSFLRDEEGATAIEYGLIAALISVVIIIAVTLVGTNLTAVFARIAEALDIAVAPA
jgi:pilus assembly protein Flp/PilA